MIIFYMHRVFGSILIWNIGNFIGKEGLKNKIRLKKIRYRAIIYNSLVASDDGHRYCHCPELIFKENDL